MEGIKGLFLGRSGFHTPNEIAACIRRSENFDLERENPEAAEPLLIFQTSQQQTWLVASEARLYCILDDAQKSEPHINWSMRREELVGEADVIVPIQARDKADSERTGYLDIGPHRNWMFSRKLFTDIPIEERVRVLLRRKMLE